jgi:hypothetical protein
MVYFQSKKSEFWKILKGLVMNMVGKLYGHLEYITAIWNIFGHLVFYVNLVIFGILSKAKSGNPARVSEFKIARNYQMVVSSRSRLESQGASGPDVLALPLELSDDGDQLVAVLRQLQEVQVQAVRFVGHLLKVRHCRIRHLRNRMFFLGRGSDPLCLSSSLALHFFQLVFSGL